MKDRGFNEPLHVALLGAASSVHLQRWAIGIHDRGHKVTVISQHAHERLPLPSGVSCIELPWRSGKGYVLNAPSLRSLLGELQPDVLSAHYASGYGVLAALARYKPTMLSVWGSDVYEFPHRGLLQRTLLKWSLRSADVLASTSHVMAEEVRRWSPVGKAIHITPFGIDTSLFFPAPALRADDVLTIGIVKSLEPTYGVDVLLHAFSLLRQDHANTRLIVVGSGSQLAQLKDLSVKLGIQEDVEFVGAVPHAEVPSWLNRFDIYVAPSRSESFGVAVLEASACALPVVVTNVGGLPEVVMADQSGLVVPSEDPDALRDALASLVASPSLRERLGRFGLERVRAQFEWGHCVDVMIDRLRSAAAQSARQRLQ